MALAARTLIVSPKPGRTATSRKTGEEVIGSPSVIRDVGTFFMAQCSHMWSLLSTGYIKSRIQSVVFDELAAGFDDISHEDRKHAIRLDGVVLIEIHLEQFCASGFMVVSKSCFGFISPRPLNRWIERPRLPISRTFVRISGMAKSGWVTALSRPRRVRRWMVAVRIVFDFQAFSGEFVDQFLGGS